MRRVINANIEADWDELLNTASGGASSSYVIELSRWNIKNDGSDSMATTAGINVAMVWAKSQGYNHVILPSGTYLVQMDPVSFSAIVMPSDMHFEMPHDCTIQLQTTSSPNYNIFQLKQIHNVKVSGGSIVGDKKTHIYEIYVKFVRGGVNPDGSLNDNPNWIRSEILDRYEHPGLLSNFRLWSIDGVSAANYHFYQYKDTISSGTLAGHRDNGGFAPANSTGRGWFLNEAGGIVDNNKMVFAIDITSSPMTDTKIAEIRAKIDNSYYTHESGYGIGLFGSNHIEITNVDISNCTGDGILAGWGEYHIDPTQYTQERIGQHIYIQGCHIHHCRRQGISICAPNDVYIFNNRIHDIGYDDDGITSNFRNGTAPMFGIDIESMVAQSNIPYKTPEQPLGLELNYRIYIYDNYIYNNVRGHFVNVDGTNVTLEGNKFEGYNVGGISSNPNQRGVQYLNNTFIGCELWVQGDNFVSGEVFHKGNLKFLDVRGAVVDNCQVKDGMVYGSSIYGYLGTPSVNPSAGKFIYSSPHGMGNGAQICFEQWVGKVPAGISVDKLYYTVNITSTSFQVSESKGGTPVTISDGGQSGFNISRYNYGRCYISNITVERDWRTDNASTPRFSILAAGAVIRNITVKNYDVSILVPSNYAGRPNIIQGLTLIEGSARVEGSHISDSQFIRAKTGLMGATDIQLGSNDLKFTRKIIAQNCMFQGLGAVLEGHTVITGSNFVNANIGKADNQYKSIIAGSYLESTKVNMHWLRQDKSATIANCVFNNVTVTGSAPYVRLLGFFFGTQRLTCSL